MRGRKLNQSSSVYMCAGMGVRLWQWHVHVGCEGTGVGQTLAFPPTPSPFSLKGCPGSVHC